LQKYTKEKLNAIRTKTTAHNKGINDSPEIKEEKKISCLSHALKSEKNSNKIPKKKKKD